MTDGRVSTSSLGEPIMNSHNIICNQHIVHCVSVMEFPNRGVLKEAAIRTIHPLEPNGINQSELWPYLLQIVNIKTIN